MKYRTNGGEEGRGEEEEGGGGRRGRRREEEGGGGERRRGEGRGGGEKGSGVEWRRRGITLQELQNTNLGTHQQGTLGQQNTNRGLVR